MLEMSTATLAEAWTEATVPTEASVLADRKLGALRGVGLEELTNPT